MPTLPLYTAHPPHPDGSHRVRSPGGYERWHFDAESDDGRVRVVAVFAQGTADHPRYSEYLRRHRQYLRTPTRRAPPVCAEFSCVTLAVYEEGRPPAAYTRPCAAEEFRASADAVDLSAGTDSATAEADGSLRLSLGGGSGATPAAELRIYPAPEMAARDILLPTRDPVRSQHHWVAAAPLCAAEGTVAAEPGRSVRFTGRGYHGHHFGTAPATRWSYGRAVFDGRTIAFSAAGAEAVVIEAGAAGIHHSTVAMEFTAASLPSVIDMQPVGVKLERPRVIGGGSPVRVLYEVSGPVHPGSRPAVALCEFA